jgi:hypothetical protein
MVDVPSRREVEAIFTSRLGINQQGADDASVVGEVREFYRDRRQHIWLLPSESPGQATLQAVVEDLQLQLNTEEFQNDRVAIRAELWELSPDRGDERQLKAVVRHVQFDALPPEIVGPQNAAAEYRGEEGQPLTVQLRVLDSGSGVAKVEIAYNQENGTLKEPVEVVRTGGDDYQAAVPTENKPAGLYYLYAQAKDLVGNTSSPVRLQARIDRPTVRPGKPRPSMNNTIRGSVTVSGVPARRITVTLAGPKSGTQSTKDNGTFEFKDLPPGAYKLSAKGIFKNVERSGDPVDVTLEPAPAEPAQVQIPLN